MGLIKPQPPHFDLEDFRRLPFGERVRLSCLDWVHVGFGAPASAYLFYLLKIALWIGGWVMFVRIGGVEGGIADWWTSPIAFVKAVVWTLVWEGMGFGCGSGPLTGRYFPPFAALGHFLRPGTIVLPPFPDRLRLLASPTRSWADVGLYGLYVLAGLRLLVGDEVGRGDLVLILIPFALAALRDKTIFLSARGEHYATTVVVLAVALGDPVGSATAWSVMPISAIAGAKAVQLSIWWWAATSKLNHHFPFVVSVMLSNHPLIRPLGIRKRFFRDFPDDLRPSAIPTLLAHGGTVIEYVVPLTLVLSDGGPLTRAALIVMIAFHGWIFSSFALGVPQEWNVFFVYSAIVLFGETNAAVKPWQLDNPLLWAFLLVMLVGLPVLGNLRPDKISFLVSMRYYAGNWGTSTWLFTPEALAKFDQKVPKVSKELVTQLAMFYDDDTSESSLSRVPAFRAMHLHGRLVQRLIPRAVEDPDTYVLREGELVAGMALGWNFGDLHLHDEQLMAALQSICGFEPGDVRAVMIESQAVGSGSWEWRIVDAADGVLLRGESSVAEALGQQPWPELTGPSA